MRHAFQDDLASVISRLADMARRSSTAMERATAALLTADVALAEAVIADDAQIHALRADLDDASFDLLALQSPVATDLRTIVTSLRISSEIERMGDLARHIAKVARRRYPEQAVPAELHQTIEKMAAISVSIATKTSAVIAERDVASAREIEHDDDAMDDLHRDLVAAITSPDWHHGSEAAVDLSLLSRYYERYCDHAVTVARRIIWLVTGEESTDRDDL